MSVQELDVFKHTRGAGPTVSESADLALHTQTSRGFMEGKKRTYPVISRSAVKGEQPCSFESIGRQQLLK